jgi:hypothetical protein
MKELEKENGSLKTRIKDLENGMGEMEVCTCSCRHNNAKLNPSILVSFLVESTSAYQRFSCLPVKVT